MPNNEFGDFQTPRALAAKVFEVLPKKEWTRILEPTCGVGNFLHEAAGYAADAEIVGIEVQADYVDEARLARAEVIQADIFSMHLGQDVSWGKEGPLLVVGNPPWVTNAQLSRLASSNRPDRVNLRNLRGMDAMTGASNFDIAEFVWLKLISELQRHNPTISLLCKTQVARNILEYCSQFGLPISSASVHLINAKQWFDANVDACLFTVEVGTGPASYDCALYDSLDSVRPSRRFGVADGRLVADIDAYGEGHRVDGHCPLEWRQGMKHDAAGVMELVHLDGPHSRSGEPVDVEESHVYPLLKGTDVFRGRTGLSKWVVVTQKSLGEDTTQLAHTAPKLWSYLNKNAEALDGRKSSIYRNRPRFCVFGIGDYSFAPYKIAVSGLHKSAEFRLIAPLAGKPVFLDDTCYLLPFNDPQEAALVLALLRSKPAQDFFRTFTFWDAKRPITKKLLQKIDLGAVAAVCSDIEIIESAERSIREIGPLEAEKPLGDLFGEMKRRWVSTEAVATAEEQLF
ncbi:hypothetical protein Drose_32375 [Dactylosporangium roseum]|uniref:SAM-dependent methyltransferase n=1 Tax=Dactylosporangium roseum TaxID=47989 RepID=A0ABY5Z146_9ACTN|nr:hypothetical protein [Dactylosporangium roseum]UWZ35751.1 hypothetical protein Drose_32375 [Dactylosporangium roseum]